MNLEGGMMDFGYQKFVTEVFDVILNEKILNSFLPPSIFYLRTATRNESNIS